MWLQSGNAEVDAQMQHAVPAHGQRAGDGARRPAPPAPGPKAPWGPPMVLAVPYDWRKSIRPLDAARPQYFGQPAVLEGAQGGLSHSIPLTAHLVIKRIEARLGKKQDDEALYKPKWQRTVTFNRYCEKIDRYENVLDERLLRSLGRIMARR
jgi:hypothetical protein